MAELLVFLPIAWAAVAFVVPSNRWRPWLLPLCGLTHLVLTASRARRAARCTGFGGWLNLDPLGKLFLGLISVLFSLCACYAPGYLAHREQRDNRVFCSCLMLSLAMMTLIILSHHLGLMWVAMEATTLVTAPGLYFNHNPRSLEATWKYLLICSVGIALALLGSLFLAYSALHAGLESTLLFDDLVRVAPQLSLPWLNAAFVFLFVGYGTKMGLAPMHTWKPDAYGEAPGMIGALMAGGLTNCAFLAILRFVHIARAAHDADFVQRIMVFTGLFSMALAAVFMARQRDFKRMLAYSSVEHMGILALGVGIGGAATFAALLHVINNGLDEGRLVSIRRQYPPGLWHENDGGRAGRAPSPAAFGLAVLARVSRDHGVAAVWAFYQRILLARGRLARGTLHGWRDVRVLPAGHFHWVRCDGHVNGPRRASRAAENTNFRDTFTTSWPIVVLLSLVLVLGVYLPPRVATILHEADSFLASNPVVCAVHWANVEHFHDDRRSQGSGAPKWRSRRRWPRCLSSVLPSFAKPWSCQQRGDRRGWRRCSASRATTAVSGCMPC